MLPIPLSLYIHLPWCVRKCPYCDFNSHQLDTELPEQAYIDALIADLEQDISHPAMSADQRVIQSIFIGGGTPSLFSAQALNDLINRIRTVLAFKPDLEITMEANPGTLEHGRLHEFYAVGINRLSLGIQSFNDTHLRRLGRIHSATEATQAVTVARKAGFRNFNIDLMYGLPDQSVAQAEQDIASAIALAPTHISHYQLTLEPNTVFYKYPPPLPDDDLSWAMQQRCQEKLAQHGYEQYEISAYAQHQHRCQHNLNYWQFGDYLAIGAGAHGKLSDPATGLIERYWKVKNPRDYLRYAGQSKRIGSRRTLAQDELGLEFMMNALRLIQGVPSQLFVERTGLSLHSLRSALAEGYAAGWLEAPPQRLQTTTLGAHFLNDVLQLFLTE